MMIFLEYNNIDKNGDKDLKILIKSYIIIR